MIRPIVHDPLFLARPSEPATREDLPTAWDLVDTLTAHMDRCVGMAANMIGVSRRIIVIARGPMAVVMLFLEDVRKTKRYKTIRLSWQDMQMKEHTETLEGFQAQIVQHELDHCDGILI